MKVARHFEQGDIIRFAVSAPDVPAAEYLALVLSPAAFNALGTMLVAPICHEDMPKRYAGFGVALDQERQPRAVLVNLMRTIEWTHHMERVGTASSTAVAEALAKARAILS